MGVFTFGKRDHETMLAADHTEAGHRRISLGRTTHQEDRRYLDSILCDQHHLHFDVSELADNLNSTWRKLNFQYVFASQATLHRNTSLN
jgi:hypothetical protein